MGFKIIDRKIGFAELALSSAMEKDVGTSTEGADAYPPLMLFKCLLLQKWFRISSDPELESQVSDRISFKTFLKLPFDMPSPDPSTFSRFGKWLSLKAMIKINSEVLNQFANEGPTINELPRGKLRGIRP